MSFFFKWLRPERPSGVALHPAQTVESALPPARAFERCVQGIENVLGGVVRERDAQSGTIDATFGLVNSERISVTVEPLDEGSRIIIESRRVLSAEPPRPSPYVGALARFLQSG
jgi:hypothetical protein